MSNRTQRLFASILGMILGFLLVTVVMLGQISSKLGQISNKINQHPTVLIKCQTGTQCEKVAK